MFNELPTEIIGLILKFISRYDTNQVSQTCKSVYKKSLPFLYAHLTMGKHVHVKQLQQGVLINPFLKQTILLHTKKLTLKSQQNNNQWRVHDLVSILSTSSNIQSLFFCDFQALSVDTILRIVSILPRLFNVEYHYCHIIYRKMLDVQTLIGTTQVQQLRFSWTDFTQLCIPYILFPNITRIELGSNRNKHDKINSYIVQSLSQYCPLITHLTITLPQVSSSSLGSTVAQYGTQLQFLSVPCDSVFALDCILKYATRLEALSIRATSNQALDCTIPGVFQLTKLKQLDISSCHLERHVPDIIWESIEGQESKAMLEKRRNEKGFIVQRHPSIEGNIWFYTVSEEALQQRAYYLQSFPGYKNQKMKSIHLNQKDIFKIKNRLFE